MQHSRGGGAVGSKLAGHHPPRHQPLAGAWECATPPEGVRGPCVCGRRVRRGMAWGGARALPHVISHMYRIGYGRYTHTGPRGQSLVLGHRAQCAMCGHGRGASLGVIHLHVEEGVDGLKQRALALAPCDQE